MEGEHPLFTTRFVEALKSLVERHHSIYPRVSPQGIFFESLVERAFLAIGWPRNQVIPTPANSPSHDLTVGATKISVKTETGLGTKPTRINITKLCTTETGEWSSEPLIRHVLNHLGRYDHILMLRALLSPGVAYHYQLLEVPLELLRRIDGLTAMPVGTRVGRRSLAMDVLGEGGVLFHVHFDGADGKCQIQRLQVETCRMLIEWDQPTDA
jgi:hypothetical protein